MSIVTRALEWFKERFTDLFFTKPEPPKESWIDSCLRRVHNIKPKALNAYKYNTHGNIEIDVYFKNVETLLEAITDTAISIENSLALPAWIDATIEEHSTIVDEWLVTNDNYSIDMRNLKEVLKEKLMNYRRVLNALNEPTKSSYYMRVTGELNRDIDTLVDLITNDWEKHEIKEI